MCFVIMNCFCKAVQQKQNTRNVPRFPDVREVTWTLEKGSMTLMRFCSSRLSYSLVRWVLMMGSSLSSALYSVNAFGSEGGRRVLIPEVDRTYRTGRNPD